MTSSKGYTFSMEQESQIDFNSLKNFLNTKMPSNDDITLIRTKSLNRCRLFVIDQEYFINHEIIHSFPPDKKQLAYEVLFTELCLTYELPLCRYITSSTSYDYVLDKVSKQHLIANEAITLSYCKDLDIEFPFFVCNFYTNSSPIMLDDAQSYGVYTSTTLIDSLSHLISLLWETYPNCKISHVQRCILNKYNLIS